jgi:hypothetical protein
VIDKLEVSVGRYIPFTRKFEYEYRAIRSKAASEYYRERIDLRQCGLQAILHRSCRFNGSHKVAVLETAKMSLREMVVVIGSVFECDPWDSRVARLDLAVDVPGIPVHWFRKHMCVPRKRQIKVIGVKEESSEEGDGTTYFGRGADLFRVYDKEAELRSRSCQPADADGRALTRIERQFRSGRIPSEMRTLRDLNSNAADFNPFASVVLLPGGKAQLDPRAYPLRRYLEGIGLRQLVLDNDLQSVWNIVSARSRGNARRKLRQLSDFLPPDSPDFQVPDLFELYLRSLHRQLSEHKSVTENALARKVNRSELRSHSGCERLN